jgi:RNA polymerase sigma-70 factor (ECF subfamily)
VTDLELISAVKAGDNRAFSEIVQRYESRIAGTVIGMLGPCAEADDVGQETFIRFYRSLGNFKGDSTLATYLTRIAINLSLNELKRRKRGSRFFSLTTETDQVRQIPDRTADSSFNENSEMINRALQQLEPKFKSVVVLRLIEGYSTAETAKILDIPLGTVLSRLARAQKKMKMLLSPYYGAKNEKKVA